MAISRVRAQLNGSWYTLSYDSSSGQYKATLTAPGATSRNQTGGYYNVSVEATNTAGTIGSADGATLTGLRLVVKERIPPVIKIIKPSDSAYVTIKYSILDFTVQDEENGSGVDLDSLTILFDGLDISDSPHNYMYDRTTNEYTFSYELPAPLSEGQHVIKVSCSDYDGNVGTGTTTFIVDTVPPSLNITKPTNNLVTAAKKIEIEGTTSDATSGNVTVHVTLNGVDVGNATVSSTGEISKTVDLDEGSNTIVIRATDAAGKHTEITRTVVLDTTVPVVKVASITPNPADAGASVIIAVTIAEE